MKRLTCRISVALVVLALCNLPVRARAQAPHDQVPFKFTLVGTPNFVALPVNPVIVSVRLSTMGESPLLGQATYVDHAFHRMGVEGNAIAVTDGIGVIQAANGDALFVSFVLLFRPPVSEGTALAEGVFTITGGAGRFSGAAGNGIVSITVNLTKNFEITQVYDGTVSRPK